MKTALSIVGIVFLFLLLCLGGVIGVVVYVGASLDSSSKAYVDESVPAIVTTWSAEEMSQRESPQFRRITPDEKLPALLVKFSRLGTMQSYDGSKGEAHINFSPITGFQITATYLAQATFQNGKAEIRVTLVRVHGAWKLFGFRVNSPLFTRKQ